MCIHIRYASDFVKFMKLLESIEKGRKKNSKALKIVYLLWWCFE